MRLEYVQFYHGNKIIDHFKLDSLKLKLCNLVLLHHLLKLVVLEADHVEDGLVVLNVILAELLHVPDCIEVFVLAVRGATPSEHDDVLD